MEIARDVTVTISVFPKGSILRLSKEGGGVTAWSLIDRVALMFMQLDDVVTLNF